VIAAREVSVAIGDRRLLDQVSLTVEAGELVVLAGPNGAGKSTLLAVLGGDRRPTSGVATLAGTSPHELGPARLAARRAFLPQRPRLTAAFTVAEVIALGGAVDAAARGRALAAVGLDGLGERLYPTLSGGEQRRVQLARVLAQLGDGGDRALFLDEPTAALDPRQQHRVMALARRAADLGHAVVVVLHELTLALAYADRIALLAHGRLIACVPPRRVTEGHLALTYDTEFELVALPSGARAAIARADAPPRSGGHL